MKILFGVLIFCSLAFADSWKGTVIATSDSLPRIACPMKLSLPASVFNSSMPAVGTVLYSQLVNAKGAAIPSQIIWSLVKAGEPCLVWVEDSVPAKTDIKYSLTISTSSLGSTDPVYTLTHGDSGIDVRHGTRAIYHYQDIFDPKNAGLTRRPWHHVYGSDGKYITKGGDGEYPHQRGIMMGWSVSVNGGQEHGYWTCGGGSLQIHQKYDTTKTVMGPVYSRVSQIINWQHNDSVEVVETRVMESWDIKPGVHLFDLRFTLEQPNGKTLGLLGEGAHAGMQFIAGAEVNENSATNPATQFSSEGKIGQSSTYAGKSPWIAQLFTIRNINYMAMVMDHSTNPKPTTFPTRPYGRFGIFFLDTVAPGVKVPLYYRFLITDRTVRDSSNVGRAFNSFQFPVATRFENGVVSADVNIQKSQTLCPRLSLIKGELRIAFANPLTDAIVATAFSVNGRQLGKKCIPSGLAVAQLPVSHYSGVVIVRLHNENGNTLLPASIFISTR